MRNTAEAAVPPPGGAPAAPAPASPLPPPIFNPMLSVGHQLMKARQARGLSIEDIAFETRIPHRQLRDMENDDLSNFANLTYAKGFLKLYSRFLDLDLSDYLDEFDTGAISDVTGHEYAHTAGNFRLLSAPAIAPDDCQRGRLIGNLVGIAAFAVLGIGGWMFYKSRTSPALDTGAVPTVVAPASTPAVETPLPPVEATPPAPPASATVAQTGTGHLAKNPPPSPPSPPKAVVVPADDVRRATIVEDPGNNGPEPRQDQL